VSSLDLLLNGERCTLPPGSTIADLVAAFTGDPARSGIAVAVDRAVVPRSEWHSTPARAGSQVEVVTAAAGG
jgi:sulfur carrier protein